MFAATLGIVWILGQVVLGQEKQVPMPAPAAVAAWGMRAFTPTQESLLFHFLPKYESLVLTALAPGHGLSEPLLVLYRDCGGSRPALAARLDGWAKGEADVPTARDGIRTWGPPAVVDSLLALDRERAAAWLADLGVAPGPLPEGLDPPPLVVPEFAPDTCGAAAPLAEGTGVIVGVARTVDGEPVAGCGVYVPAVHWGMVTGADGRFTFCNVPPGAQELKAVLSGFLEVTGTVVVRPGRDEVAHIEVLMYQPKD